MSALLSIALAAHQHTKETVMENLNRSLLAGVCVVGAVLFFPTAAFAQAESLDGKVFVADGGVKGKAPHLKGDLITFDGGKFHSSACDQYGYNKGEYKAEYKAAEEGGGISFTADTASEKDGRIHWEGSVRGSDIEGTYTHYRKGWLLNPSPAPIEHWFKGHAK
jgi:hypothetical protein